MDFYDKLCEKLNVRKLSIREKALFVVLIFLFLQLILNRTLIMPRKVYSQELSSNIELNNNSIDNSKPYTGLKNFDDESINSFIEETNLSKDNIELVKNVDETNLVVSGTKGIEDIKDIYDFTDYFGYSMMELNRSDGENFSYIIKSIKPTEEVLHKDLKSEYFADDTKKDKEENISQAKEESTKVETKENIKDIKNKNEVVVKKSKGTKNKTVKPNKKSENKIENKKINKTALEATIDPNLDKDLIVESSDPKDFLLNIEDSKKESLIFSEFQNRDVTEFINTGIIACYEKELHKNEFLTLELDELRDELKLELLIPENYNGNFGIIDSEGKYFRYDEEIKAREWNEIEFETKNISEFYFLPNEDMEIIFYLRNVYE